MKVKNQILELRKQGLSYNSIKNELGCSKGTISYHCGEGQKEKTDYRRNKRRSSNRLIQKIEDFRCKKNKNITYKSSNKDWHKILYGKLIMFCRDKKTQKVKTKFSLNDLIQKIGENPICYLTGRPINLSDSRSYHLDHIIPSSRGGSNNLDNCQITCSEANRAKNSLTYDEFIQLCKEVINKSTSG